MTVRILKIILSMVGVVGVGSGLGVGYRILVNFNVCDKHEPYQDAIYIEMFRMVFN